MFSTFRSRVVLFFLLTVLLVSFALFTGSSYAKPVDARYTVDGVEFLGELTDDDMSLHRWAMFYQTLVQCIDFRYVN